MCVEIAGVAVKYSAMKRGSEVENIPFTELDCTVETPD